MTTFVDAVLCGDADVDGVDDWIDRWHESTMNDVPLHEFLGLSWDEYAQFVTQPSSIHDVVASRRASTSEP